MIEHIHVHMCLMLVSGCRWRGADSTYMDMSNSTGRMGLVMLIIMSGFDGGNGFSRVMVIGYNPT